MVIMAFFCENTKMSDEQCTKAIKAGCGCKKHETIPLQRPILPQWGLLLNFSGSQSPGIYKDLRVKIPPPPPPSSSLLWHQA